MLLPLLFEEKLGLGRSKFEISASHSLDLFKLNRARSVLSSVED